MTESCPVLRAVTPGGEIEVRAVTPGAVRIRLFGPPVVDEASYVQRESWPDVPLADAGPTPGMVERISTGRLTVDVDASDPSAVQLAVLDHSGRRLFGTAPAGGIVREEIVDAETGGRRQRVAVHFQRTRATYDDDAHFYGLGQGGGFQLDRLGTSRLFWNTQIGHGPGSDFGIPLLVASTPAGAYGLLYDTAAIARLDTAYGRGGLGFRYEAEVSSVDVYILGGPTAADVLEAYAELTGFPAMPAKWSLGFLQSSRFFNQTEDILDVARTMREKQLPCDALIFLSTYGHSKAWNKGVGHLEFHDELWSDPAAIMGTLQDDLKFKVVTHEYPVLHPDAPQYAEAEQRGFLLDVAYPRPELLPGEDPEQTRRAQRYQENQRYIDFTNPDARAWWWDQHRHLTDLGVAGWWLDGGEGPTGPAPMHRGDARLLHNTFDLYRFRAFADGEARDRPDGRPWMLCRSGAAGMQRLGAASWSGDINTTFTTFEGQVLLGLGLAMSGVPYWGTDIGGFYPNALTPELYTRWFQFGAFCPLFRAHGWELERHFPWAHGPEVEAICRRYMELRMRLLPYLYSLAWEAHTRGLPLMRPLVLHYPQDPHVWEMGYQYLLGRDLLVAPVTRAGASSWPVYLPEGSWFDFWTGERYEGGQSIAAATPLDTVPVFVRGGGIIPLGPVMQRTDEHPLDVLTLLVYPGESGACTLYEDDGASQAYRDGQRALTEIHSSFDDGVVRVEIGATAGAYAGQPDSRDLTVRVWSETAPEQVQVTVGGQALSVTAVAGEPSGPPGAYWWREEPHWTVVQLPAVQRSASVSVQFSS
ncbi:MAG: TIM-barrel domain-containing protein [Chloroflexota bacterium]